MEEIVRRLTIIRHTLGYEGYLVRYSVLTHMQMHTHIQTLTLLITKNNQTILILYPCS